METSQSQSSLENNGPENVEKYPGKDDNKLITLHFQGCKIFVGLNALTNEKLVSEHKKLHKKCIWMHAYEAKGSHVIICLMGKEGLVEDIVFRRAMDLTTSFSVYKEEQAKKIVWSELQDVFKPIEGICGVWKTYKQNNVLTM